VKCKFLGSNGVCTGKYAGYGCIKSSCVSFKKAQNCEHRDPVGDYCKKYGRFGCVGRDSCQSIADYLEAVAEEQA
jgi:hypothetical protein